ncbi:MAG: hypothetical protein ACI4YA_03025 [Candidatus Spyradenecus sp.]
MTLLPSQAELEHWNRQWESLPRLKNYYAQEKALEWLFKAYPQNTVLEQVLIKVTALDTLYSTSIFHITETAQHICTALIDFDARVKEGDLSLVKDLAVFKVVQVDGQEREKHIFSFASKYCSWHNPEAYPIYDSKVRDKLRAFKNDLGKDLVYTKGSLDTYDGFCNAMAEVRDKFHLDPSMKRIDRYLWAWAKDDDCKASNSKTTS